MRRSALALSAGLGLALALALAAAGAAGNNQSRAGHATGSFVPGEVLVRFAPRLPAADVRGALGRLDARVEGALPAVPGLKLVDLPRGASVREAAQEYEDLPGVLYAEPNYRRELLGVPEDPLIPQQWAVRNTGRVVFGVRGRRGADAGVRAAWRRQGGSPSVTIAVPDTGVALRHPDLRRNIWRNPGEIPGNGIDDDANGFADDVHGWDFAAGDANPVDQDDADQLGKGHGTRVAGVIAARGANGIGIAGVAWRTRVMPIRVPLTVAGQIAAIEYAKRNGARIVSTSSGQQLPSASEKAAIDAAPGILFVTASGNDGHNLDAAPTYPCAYDSPNVICVGASGQRDRLSRFSNYGPATVDLVAPGDNILSTIPAGAVTETFVKEFAAGGRRLRKYLTGPIDVAGTRACNLAYSFHAGKRSRGARLRVEISRDHGPFRILRTHRAAEGGFHTADLPARIKGAHHVDMRFRVRGGALRLGEISLECVAARAGWGYDSGTSFAAPMVAGAAGLLLAEHPLYSVAEVKAALLGSVDRRRGLAGRVASGGRLDASAALAPD